MPLDRSILVVDADRQTVSMVKRALESARWSIDQEPDGTAALLRVAEHKYGVIVAALESPAVGGPDFVHRLRRIRPNARVIVLADTATPAVVIESIKAHAFSCFSKPVNAQVLAQLIESAVDTPAWSDGIEVLAASPHWIELRVRCRMVSAERVVQFLREMKLALPAEEREAVATAFREMLFNAMEHGAQFDPEQTVDVSYMRTRRSIIYRISDPGPGFSLDQLPHAAVSNPSPEPTRHVLYRLEHGMRAGGFGILLARNMVDELVYNESGNKVLLVKYLKTQPD
jgi:DNA-binding NarL/FixJ family response regulator